MIKGIINHKLYNTYNNYINYIVITFIKTTNSDI